MKKLFIIVLSLFMCGALFCSCGKTAKSPNESSQKSKKASWSVSTDVLDECVSKSKYYSSPFSITVAELVNSYVDNYKITYYTGREAIKKGFLQEEQIEETVNIDRMYYAVISGDVMQNPDLPHMTEKEDEAVKVWMIFDDTKVLKNSGVELCRNLQTCAIIKMTSSY